MALFHKYSFKYVLCVSSINSDVFVVLLNLTIGYSWSDGSSLNYLNWGLNQPDNYKGTEKTVLKWTLVRDAGTMQTVTLEETGFA